MESIGVESIGVESVSVKSAGIESAGIESVGVKSANASCPFQSEVRAVSPTTGLVQVLLLLVG